MLYYTKDYLKVAEFYLNQKEELRTPETSVNIYYTTQHSITKKSHIHTDRREDLKRHGSSFVFVPRCAIFTRVPFQKCF
jgi:hypothetical protein